MIDLLAIAVAASTASVGFALVGSSALGLGWLALFAAILLTLLAGRGLYRRNFFERLHVQSLDDARAVVTVSVITTALVVTIEVLVGVQAAWQTLVVGAGSCLLVNGARIALATIQVSGWRQGRRARRTLILGAGDVGCAAARRLLEHPELGLHPVCFYDDDPRFEGGVDKVPVRRHDFEGLLEREGIQHVIVAFSRASHERLLQLIDECQRRRIAVAYVPRLFEKLPNQRVSMATLGAMPLMAIRPHSAWQFRLKYGCERATALLLLLLGMPFLVLIAAGVWLSLGQPLLFQQVRVTAAGREFEMLKFRSMRTSGGGNDDAPPRPRNDHAPGGIEGADRRTRFGTFIRKTSLDELPQLINVLRGEMSLIGPRPERPEFTNYFNESVHRYAERHRVRTGITGWAQVHGLRGNTSLRDRVDWDNYYIDNWTPWLDIKIVLMTLKVALFRRDTVE